MEEPRNRVAEPERSEGAPQGPEAGLAELDPDRGRPAHVVCARDLTLRIGSKEILSGLDVDIAGGTITAVIGPTGTGKTVFLRTLNRMNDKVSDFSHDGDVTINGESIWARHRDLLVLRREVGMMFQRPNPFPMSVRDNVVAGVRAHRLARGRQLDVVAEARLRQVGLWEAVKDRLGDSPFRLSGGQQQLLCMARMLAIGSQVLLLDEPTSSLDPFATEAVEELVRGLTPGYTIVIVTHNLGQARRLSDHTIFLNGGRLVEHGPTEQVFGHPREPETQRYVAGHFG